MSIDILIKRLYIDGREYRVNVPHQPEIRIWVDSEDNSLRLAVDGEEYSDIRMIELLEIFCKDPDLDPMICNLFNRLICIEKEKL